MARVQNPCIGVCDRNGPKDVCPGCYRTGEEIDGWLVMSQEQRAEVIQNTIKRKNECKENILDTK